MATTPDRLKAEAEQAREKLAHDVDELTGRASPKRMLKQGSERVREATPGQARDKLRSLSHQVQRAAGRNPLVASLVVGFGAGFFAARLIPRRHA